MGKKVSFIVLIYNSSQYLEGFLQSLWQQTYPNIEFIFVNDGSADDSQAVLFSFKQKFLDRGFSFIYAEQPNQGQSSAMNLGLRFKTGTYLTWADADDWLYPDNVAQKVAFLENHPDFGMVRCNGGEVKNLNYDPGDLDRISRYLATLEDAADQHPFKKVFSGASFCHAGCYMIREELFARSNQNHIFESRVGQNLQMLLPSLSRTKCGFLPEILFLYNIHEDSHSHQKQNYLQRRQRIEDIYQLRMELLEISAVQDREAYQRLAKKLRLQDLEALNTGFAAIQRERMRSLK